MSIGKVNEFDAKTGVWSSYIERLEMYFTANSVKSEIKLPTLIAVMGDDTYELLLNLSSPRKPSELSYKEAVDLLCNHLQPTPSALAERFRFRQRRQTATETIAEYVAELKKLTRHCKLGDNLNDNLRDQFVCGLRSDVIHQRLFAEDDTLGFASAVKIATSLEAAERDAAAVDTAGRQNGGNGADVHSLAVNNERGRWSISRGGRGARGDRSGRQGGAARTGGAGPGEAGEMRGGGNCSGCGATGHSYETCRFRNYVCSRCKRPGHLRRVCRGQSAGMQRDRSTKVHYGAVQEESDTEGQEQEDFHHLCLSDYKAVSIPVIIESKVINMEIDTGAAVSCISEVLHRKYFSHLKIEPTPVCLNFYDGSVLKPVGIIKPKVRYGKIVKVLELFIIEGGTTSLLGRQWLTELKIKIPLFSNCNKISDNCQLDVELKKLFNRYKELFSGGLGRYTGGKATLRVREGAEPVFHRARPLPYALRERVDAELDAMLRDGVIEPVDCSDWASPLVPTNLSWNPNSTITFFNERWWHFEPGMSNGSLTDNVTSINPIIATVAYTMRHRSAILNTFVDAFLRLYHQNMFLTANVSSWLFDGIDDPIIDIAENFPNLPLNIPFDKFGWFYTRNGSIDFDGAFHMNTGATDFSQLGNIELWRFSNRTMYRDECGVVQGSTGELWAPELGQPEVYIFASDICTFMTLTKDKSVTIEGIEGVQYAANDSVFDNGYRYPHMACYCDEVRDRDCLPPGALNVSACRFGAPAFVSLPHFLNADPYYPSKIEGLNPTSEHNFRLSLEMFTGMPLAVAAQLQINLLVRHVGGIALNNRLPDPDTLVPMFWFRQELQTTPEYAAQARMALRLRYWVPYGLIALTVIGVALLVPGIIILFKRILKSPETRPILSESSSEDSATPAQGNQ